MTYELCLEYGTYPLRPVDAWADEINTAPAFITEDKKRPGHHILTVLEPVFTAKTKDKQKAKAGDYLNHTN